MRILVEWALVRFRNPSMVNTKGNKNAEPFLTYDPGTRSNFPITALYSFVWVVVVEIHLPPPQLLSESCMLLFQVSQKRTAPLSQ